MKPTVINNNNSEPSQPAHHEQPQQQQQHVDNNGPNNGQNPGISDQSRRFPNYRQPGFGFGDHDDDLFGDIGRRSRLNRMGRPFDWNARKRGGNAQASADPYDHYFHDDVDFPQFSTWDAFNRMGNKRSQQPNDRSGFFDYLPQEFRQYMPDNFSHFDRQMYPNEQYRAQQHPQPAQPKSNLCDAAIQTDDLDSQPSNNGLNNQQSHLNQPTAPENNVHRSASSASSSSSSGPHGNNVYTSTQGPGAFASASADGHQQNAYPAYGSGRPHQQHAYNQQYGSPHQTHFYGQPQQQAPPQPQPNPQQNEGHVRNVPIFFEGSKVPVTRTAENQAQQTSPAPPAPPAPPAQHPSHNATHAKPRPDPLKKESFQSNQPIPAPAPPTSSAQQTTAEQQTHSDPTEASDEQPPQTPHTADCISKIQAIQRDVLQLMCAVEQFGGERGDKDYMYLDEMLTRNLLKLDTIDTNGKESIRLARKEAIKCIQASIAVLEAKASLHLNEKQGQAGDEAAAADGEQVNQDNGTEKVETASNIEALELAVAPPSVEANAEPVPELPEDVRQIVENICIDDKLKGSDGVQKSEQAENVDSQDAK